MEFKTIAEYRKNEQYDLIAAEGDKVKFDDIEDEDIKLFIAEAYLKDSQYQKSALWYWKCMDIDPDECGQRLIYILKNTGDIDSLEKLEEESEEYGCSEGMIALCRYEISRLRKHEVAEQIESLRVYVEEDYEPYYMLRLAELNLLMQNEDGAKRILRQCSQLYPNSEYSDMATSFRTSIEKGEGLQYIRDYTVEKKLYKKLVEKEENGVSKALSSEEDSKREKGAEKKSLSLLEKLGKKKVEKRKKYHHEESINIEEAFENIYGMKEIRKKLGNLYRMLQIEEERSELGIQASLIANTNFIIDGDRATGKTMLALTIHKLLYAFGVREEEMPILVEAREFTTAVQGLLDESGKTIIIENIEKCADDEGLYDSEQILWPLKKLLSKKKKELSIVITGTTEGIRALLAQEPDLDMDIYQKFDIPRYSLEEWVNICLRMAESEYGCYIDDKAQWYLRKLILRNYKKTSFNNAQYFRNLLDDAKSKMADRLDALGSSGDLDVVTLVYDDFLNDDDGEEEIKKAIYQLDNLIGLKAVKEIVLKKINEVSTRQEEEEQGVEIQVSPSKHLVFYGNPGTGKTTVARIIGQIYYSLGILPENKMVECTAGDLVSAYVGDTAKKTRSKVQEALGGVLFIDEAYTLASDKGAHNDQAVDELIKQMEDHRDDLMVIMAGYQKSMEHFFDNTNEGLRGRFPAQNRIIFEDYTSDELVQIFKLYTEQAGFELEEGTDEKILQLLEEKSKEDGFNNARGVRNVFEQVTHNVSDRLSEMEEKTREDYGKILLCDLEKSMRDILDNKKGKEELLSELNSLTGLVSVKKEINTLIKKIEAENFFAGLNNEKRQPYRVDNMLFLGNPGTGKTTVARLYSRILEELGILLKKNHFVEASREDFVSENVGGTAEKTRKTVEKAYGGVLFIDEAYALVESGNDSHGMEAVNTLLKLMEDHRDELVVIAAGYTKEMNEFLKSNSGLASRFSKTITFEDYAPEEMYQIFCNMAESKNISVESACEKPMTNYFSTLRRQKNFGNAREIRNLFEKMSDAMKIRCFEEYQKSEDKESIVERSFLLKDFMEAAEIKDSTSGTSVEDYLKKLDSLIGLAKVKEDVHNLIDFIQGIRRKKGETVNIAEQLGRMHMVFQGPPGTGKTTVARLIGKIYYSLGILAKDTFVECDRSSLVGAYQGHTEEKTNKKIDEAMGGVLFVDEAYDLASGGENDYGARAINVLLKRMEDERHDFVVILAGYTEDMKKLFEINRGFVSRVPNAFTFENYTTEEMWQIFLMNAKKENMGADKEAEIYIKDYFDERSKDKNFANARDVETLFEKAKRKIYQKIGEGESLPVSEENTIITYDLLREII